MSNSPTTSSSSDPATLSASLLLQSPPGQVDAVYHDLLSISGVPPSTFSSLSKERLQRYNEENLIYVEGSVISEEARCERERYVDQSKAISFGVDHKELKLQSPVPLPDPLPSQATSLRTELDKLLKTYLADHFPEGAASVLVVGQNYKKAEEKRVQMEEDGVGKGEEEGKAKNEEGKEGGIEESTKEDKPTTALDADADADGDDKMASPAPPKDDEAEERKESSADGPKEVKSKEEAEEPNVEVVKGEQKQEEEEPVKEPTKLVIHISGNKYNLANYWSGRWLSSYYLTLAPSLSLEARSSIHVHYFENGNVQLRTSTPLRQLPLSNSTSEAQSQAKSILKSIREAEDGYERDVINRTKEMGEGAFRALRRTLPVTKQKMDWEKVLNYKLSTELGK